MCLVLEEAFLELQGSRAFLSTYGRVLQPTQNRRRQLREGSTPSPGIPVHKEFGHWRGRSLERTWRELRSRAAVNVLDKTRAFSPRFFEKLVVRLLVAMSYGGAYADAASVVGKSGDEGIDGIIKEDRLGLDVLYVQAKRWQNVVGRPTVQAFAGKS